MLKENHNPNAVHSNNEVIVKKKTPTFGYLQPTTSSINRRRLLKESKMPSPAIISNNQFSYNDNDNENSKTPSLDNKLFTPLLDITNIVNNNQINSHSSSKYSIQFTETKKTISPVDYSSDVLREFMTPYSENNNDTNIPVVVKCSLLDDESPNFKHKSKRNYMSFEKKCFFLCLIAILALLSAYYVNYHKQKFQIKQNNKLQNYISISINDDDNNTTTTTDDNDQPLKVKLNYSNGVNDLSEDNIENEDDEDDYIENEDVYDSMETAIEPFTETVDENEIAEDSDIAEDIDIETALDNDSENEEDYYMETALDIESADNIVHILNQDDVSCHENTVDEVVQDEDNNKTETIKLDQIENKPDPMIITKYDTAQHLSIMLFIFSLRISFSFIKFYMSN